MTLQSSDLHKVWSAPDNSRLTSKQYSLRLPVHVAAKLATLCEMYPQRTRTEIVGDLLAAALEEVVTGLPAVKGQCIGKHPDTGEMIYEDLGPRQKFWTLANKHYRELEAELGNETPTDLYTDSAAVTESDLKAQ